MGNDNDIIPMQQLHPMTWLNQQQQRKNNMIWKHNDSLVSSIAWNHTNTNLMVDDCGVDAIDPPQRFVVPPPPPLPLPPPTPNSTSRPWMMAIRDATQCLRDHASQQQDDGVESNVKVRVKKTRTSSVEVIDYSIHYLIQLKTQLLQYEYDWDKIPSFDPPPFVPYEKLHPIQETKKAQKKKQKKIEATKKLKLYTANRFALLEESNDDGDDNGGDVSVKSPNDIETEGNDTDDGDDITGTHNMRRIVIRIVAALSELFAYQGRLCRRTNAWALGASHFQSSLGMIEEGVKLAQYEVSQSLSFCNQGPTASDEGGISRIVFRQQLVGLMEDADIVEMAAQSLTTERDVFLRTALWKKAKLMKQLVETKLQRDLVRRKMGEERWMGGGGGNSRGDTKKRTLSQKAMNRRTMEDTLYQLAYATDHLIQLDTHFAQQSVRELKMQLQQQPWYYRYNHNTRLGPQELQHKHDPKTPNSSQNTGAYPDPTLFGWEFTGSYSNTTTTTTTTTEDDLMYVEYFEKYGILLDWYPVTKEMQLSWLRMAGQDYVSFYHSDGPITSLFYLQVLQSEDVWQIVGPQITTTSSSFSSSSSSRTSSTASASTAMSMDI